MRHYVIAVSGRSEDSVAAHAEDLARYLSGGQHAPARVAFGHLLTLPAVACTLLRRRETLTHRLACTAGSIAEAAEKLSTAARHTGDHLTLAGLGIYTGSVPWSLFGGERHAEDRDYLSRLAAGGRHDQLARLWTVGYPVDWALVYPELRDERPVYLPPTRLSRRRYWPAAERPARKESVAPQPEPVIETVEPTVPVTPGPVAPAAEPAPGGLARELAGLPPTLRQQHLRGYLQERIARLLGFPDDELPAIDTGFFDLGMTSVHLEQVRGEISDALSFRPSETSAFEHSTIAEFARYLERSIDVTAAAPSTLPSAAPSAAAEAEIALPSLDAIDALSAVDLERVLIEAVGR
ncbi:MAG TPA: phosphopantetheine-binding protein [Amycolatopsis sp.]|uniref:acyl carrier protein n=1 Tax=Amycolatopsis sp. TaxID=37632 RepID=UPI002B4A5E25|nr:phosphopantetheine-binding protein [Amycolatopsis sp.]HJQ45739.1 phosphopantetheine-binding protein [Amycolatopsis sp.]HKS46061.1 phosphopantetheine-binding protein [Amycolatopsis sp.]